MFTQIKKYFVLTLVAVMFFSSDDGTNLNVRGANALAAGSITVTNIDIKQIQAEISNKKADHPEVEESKPMVEQAVYKGVLAPSGFTAEELAAGLNGPLKEYAWCFVKAEKETGVNAVFLASVAGLESGWGRSDLAVQRNNLFGWTGAGGYMTFTSKEECIAHVARAMKELYLTPGASYFRGYEVEDINVCYNGRQVWADTVKGIMRSVNKKAEGAQIKAAL